MTIFDDLIEEVVGGSFFLIKIIISICTEGYKKTLRVALRNKKRLDDEKIYIPSIPNYKSL
jgi:hypothetical protein